MIRAVVDATTIVSALPAAPGGTLAALVDRWQAGEYGLVVSEHILDEVERAWAKPYWRTRLTPNQVVRASPPTQRTTLSSPPRSAPVSSTW